MIKRLSTTCIKPFFQKPIRDLLGCTSPYVEIIKLRAQIEQDEQLYIAFESIDQLILQLDAQIETCIHQLTDCTQFLCQKTPYILTDN
jgi:hypothetical protein